MGSVDTDMCTVDSSRCLATPTYMWTAYMCESNRDS